MSERRATQLRVRRDPNTNPPAPAPESLVDSLPELSPQDLAFAQAVLEGMPYTDALRRAKPHTQKWKAVSVQVEACRLAAKPYIQAYLSAARRLGMQQGFSTLPAFIAEASRIRHLAVEAEQFTAAARLIETEGKALGHLSNQPNVGLGESLGPDELVVTMRARFGAEAGRRLAAQLGILDAAAPVTIDGEAQEKTV